MCSLLFPYSFVCLCVRVCVHVSIQTVSSLKNNKKNDVTDSPRGEITWLEVDGGIILKCNEAWRESLESLTLDQDEYPWRAVVNTVMNIGVLSKCWQCE